MDLHIVTLWIVCFSCLIGLAVTLKRIRSGVRGWVILYLAILLLSAAAWWWGWVWLIYSSAVLWLTLVVLPGLMALRYHRYFMQQRYDAARRLARIISWLHPADGWREQPEIMHALDLAQSGAVPEALEIFKRHQSAESPTALAARTNFYRITGQWDEFLAWSTQHREPFNRHPHFLHVLLRARGETGDLPGLIEFYQQHEAQIAKLDPPVQRDLCRLMLFAFLGRQDLAERLLRGPLGILPRLTQDFWLATAQLAAGERETARLQLEAMLPKADATMRLAIERRLAQSMSPTETALPADQGIIARTESEHSQDERFGARPTLFSRYARGTQLILALNALMFAAEIWFGGTTDHKTLLRLGAMYPPAVQADEWWRLIAAAFLHFGPIHLLMNMLALWVLGPFTEFAFGLRRFLYVYLISGIGSMVMVMLFASGSSGQQLTVGASGCVMGLVGATGALMLRGWLRERARTARKRLFLMFAIVVMQSLFDALVPQVSMTAHLSGAGIGFTLGMLLSDRLRLQKPQRVDAS